MAVTATLQKATANAIQLELVHDGGGGDDITFTRAELLAFATEAGPLRDLLSDPDIEASTAAMEQALFGKSPAAPDLDNVPHCAVFVYNEAGQTIPEVGIVFTGVNELGVTLTTGVAAQVNLLLQFQHTITR